MAGPAPRESLPATALAGLVGIVICGVVPGALAGPDTSPATADLGEVLVTGQRDAGPAADATLTARAAEALHADPMLYDGHITVTVRDGVATLHGIVFDDWDLRMALRLARHVPGVRRVVNDLEIKLGGE